MMREKKSQTPEILTGWKSIAQHLGMGVRTVQRYERQMGLPIRRPAGKMRGSVLATKSELDAWVAASPIRESFQLVSATMEASSVKALKNSVEEMRVLRDQMSALRSELKASMHSLRLGIQSLRGDLRPSHWEDPAVVADNPDSRRLLEWISQGTSNWKAS